VTAVMMRLNYDHMAALAQVAAAVGANLRVNVYQPSKTDQFSCPIPDARKGGR